MSYNQVVHRTTTIQLFKQVFEMGHGVIYPQRIAFNTLLILYYSRAYYNIIYIIQPIYLHRSSNSVRPHNAFDDLKYSLKTDSQYRGNIGFNNLLHRLIRSSFLYSCPQASGVPAVFVQVLIFLTKFSSECLTCNIKNL